MLELQKSAQESSLTEIAWQCGYYDLAHMTNDFTQLYGYSPSKIIEMGAHLTEAFQKEFSSQMKKKVLLENVE
ncbi:MAG: helix-turn-helix domain-containing protein [Bacteroidaceae bacterium]|nr:helix-turn-helix domain-containing protein [Bacteroidaceae bacterium]